MPTSLQLQYNPPNLPMFELGTKPFFGDYLDVAGAPRFVPNGNGTWSYNTAPSTAPVFHAVWTDNRDVVGPPDGDWTSYVPPGEAHTSLFDGTTPVPDCETTPGAATHPDAQPEHLHLAPHERPLRRRAVERAAVVHGLPARLRGLRPERHRHGETVRTRDPEPACGGTASFDAVLAGRPRPSPTIGAYSSISQTVFVTSSDPGASVDVRVPELGGCGHRALPREHRADQR